MGDKELAEYFRIKLEILGYKLKAQEIPFDHVDSCCMFNPLSKPTVATPGAINMHSMTVIYLALEYLQALAKLHHGIDYLQVCNRNDGTVLWFIEDGEGGAITALLPSDY